MRALAWITVATVTVATNAAGTHIAASWDPSATRTWAWLAACVPSSITSSQVTAVIVALRAQRPPRLQVLAALDLQRFVLGIQVSIDRCLFTRWIPEEGSPTRCTIVKGWSRGPAPHASHAQLRATIERGTWLPRRRQDA